MEVVAGALVAGGSIWASKEASDAAEEAADDSVAAQMRMYYQNREDMKPWRDAGKEALDYLGKRLEDWPGGFETSPGYKFRRKEGEKAINRAMARRGKWDSGAAVKALTKYSQGLASEEYGNWFNRQLRSLNPWFSMANLSLPAVQTGVQTGQQTAGNVGNILQQKGYAQGYPYMQAGKSISGFGQDLYDTWLMRRSMNPAGSGSGSGSDWDYVPSDNLAGGF